MRYVRFTGLPIVLCCLSLSIGCGSSGTAPASISGNWLFEIVDSQCPEGLGGLLDENGGTAAQVFFVDQTGTQVSAQFVDGGGGICSLVGTYGGGQFRGQLTLELFGRSVLASVEGFARFYNGRRQVDGWLRIEGDSQQQCVGDIVEFCAVLDVEPPAENVGPTVTLLAPAQDVCIEAGTLFPISYRDNDPDDTASTTIYADRDGDLGTTDDRIVIASNRPEQNGTTQNITWNTAGVTASVYRIIARTTDGALSDEDTAPGTVTIVCDTPITLDYATGASASNFVLANAVAAFEDGSYVVAGQIEGTAVFGAGEANETSLTSEGAEDVFVARYNADGALRWARRAGGPTTGGDGEGDWADDVDTFPDGSCVITGRINGTVNFGLGEENETFLTASGGDDPFIARYDADGNLLWVARGLSFNTDEGWAVSAFDDGTCIAAGRFFGSITFGDGESNETFLTAVDGFDIWVARFAADGSLLWARSAGGEGRDRVLASDGFDDGSVVITGFFEGTTDFGTGTVAAVDDRDGFVARYSASGNVTWATFVQGEGQIGLGGVTALLDGTCVITGHFDVDAVLGAGEPNATTLLNAGDEDVMLARYDVDGSLRWALRDGGPDRESSRRVASFPDGSILVTGTVRGLASLGAGLPSPLSFTSNPEDENDILLAHYSPDGVLLWACREGGPAEDEGRGVATFADGSFVIVGESEGPAIFGKGDPNETGLEAQMPVARYDGAPVGPALQPPDTGELTDAQVIQQCPDIDVVFIIDTSGSMIDDLFRLCGGDFNDLLQDPLPFALNIQGALPRAVARLEGLGGNVRVRILGITENATQADQRLSIELPQLGVLDPPAAIFSCIESSVVDEIGDQVPVDSGIGTPLFETDIDNGAPGGQTGVEHAYESWGAAIAIVAAADAQQLQGVVSFWRPGAVRIIVPISDEGPERGLSVTGGTDSGQEGDCNEADYQSIDNAIAIARANNAIVSGLQAVIVNDDYPPPGDHHPCVTDEMNRLAEATGGATDLQIPPLPASFNPNDLAALQDLITADLEEFIYELVVASCRTTVVGAED